MLPSSHRIPALLLKTKASPGDSYEEYFSNEPFLPTFVPVLEHRPHRQNLDFIRSLLLGGKLGRNSNAEYGGMIFTSQRAVEGFAAVVDEVEAGALLSTSEHRFDSYGPTGTNDSSTTQLPLYVVGPATSRSLASLLSRSSHVLGALNARVFGSHTGNGEALAHYILNHYHSLSGPKDTLPLLFLVGDQRRDVIPKTLMDPSLPEHGQIRVDELVVYETGVMESFAEDFSSRIALIESEAENNLAVVVVFSPSGCEAMLRSLKYIDDKGKVTEKGKARGHGRARVVNGQPRAQTRYVIATIGPTTRDYLKREFGFEVDVCAEKPSPEGVGEGVMKFMSQNIHEAEKIHIHGPEGRKPSGICPAGTTVGWILATLLLWYAARHSEIAQPDLVEDVSFTAGLTQSKESWLGASKNRLNMNFRAKRRIVVREEASMGMGWGSHIGKSSVIPRYSIISPNPPSQAPGALHMLTFTQLLKPKGNVSGGARAYDFVK